MGPVNFPAPAVSTKVPAMLSRYQATPSLPPALLSRVSGQPEQDPTLRNKVSF